MRGGVRSCARAENEPEPERCPAEPPCEDVLRTQIMGGENLCDRSLLLWPRVLRESQLEVHEAMASLGPSSHRGLHLSGSTEKFDCWHLCQSRGTFDPYVRMLLQLLRDKGW